MITTVTELYIYVLIYFGRFVFTFMMICIPLYMLYDAMSFKRIKP